MPASKAEMESGLTPQGWAAYLAAGGRGRGGRRQQQQPGQKPPRQGADGYSNDAGGSTTNLIYPIITLAIGLGLGFVAGRYFFKK